MKISNKKMVWTTAAVLILILIAIVLWKYLPILQPNDPILIAIDPGHGGPGIEQGYQTIDGTHECVMNNAVANYLAEILTQRGYDIVFTKEPVDTVYMSLDDRPEAANAAGADIFISIHHDSSGYENPQGYRVFYSSYKVNLDSDDIVVLYNGKEYDLVSDRNEWDEEGDSYTIKTITDGTVTFEINSNEDFYKIIDKTPCGAATDSEHLANLVFDSMYSLKYIEPYSSERLSNVVDEEYRVLRYADMPAVLVEAGFMSNPQNSAAIQRSENQLALATAIADAVDAYFSEE